MGQEDFARRAAMAWMIGIAAMAPAQAADVAANRAKAMERVVGIGGFFFRAKDPKKLAQWYEENLGITPVPGSYDAQPWRTEAGTTIFTPFPKNTTYFGAPSRQWMMNFRVRDLGKMAAQLRAHGIAVKVDPQLYPNGRFGQLRDPEDNPIQLWQPGGKDHG